MNVADNSVISGKLTNEERDTAIRLLKTICRWITGSISRAQYATVAEFYEFFPLVCVMSTYEADEELNRACIGTLAALGQAFTLACHVPVVLASINKVNIAFGHHGQSSKELN